MTVKMKKILQIGCSRDITSEVARAIVESGSELTYLYRKEYGLDEIYNRYLGGDENKNSSVPCDR